jgi:hypothetical protein
MAHKLKSLKSFIRLFLSKTNSWDQFSLKLSEPEPDQVLTQINSLQIKLQKNCFWNGEIIFLIRNKAQIKKL